MQIVRTNADISPFWAEVYGSLTGEKKREAFYDILYAVTRRHLAEPDQKFILNVGK